VAKFFGQVGTVDGARARSSVDAGVGTVVEDTSDGIGSVGACMGIAEEGIQGTKSIAHAPHILLRTRL